MTTDKNSVKSCTHSAASEPGGLVERLLADGEACLQPTFYKTATECIAAGACSCDQSLHREAAQALRSLHPAATEGMRQECHDAAEQGMGCWRAVHAEGELRRLRESMAPPAATGSVPRDEWRCFHCDEVFTDREAAADHFGVQIDGLADDTGCKLNQTEGGILKMLREAREELRRYYEEDNAMARTLYALGSEHRIALQREEEKGYARGLADGRAMLASAPAQNSKGGSNEW